MNALEMLRIGLEAAIAVQLALLALFIFATGDKRKPAGFFLSALCAALVIEVLLNALASAGVVPAWRTLNYFIDLAISPLLLGFVARAGEASPPLRRMDWAHALVPATGGLVLIAGFPHGPDAFVLMVQLGYLISAGITGWRRREVLRAADIHTLTLVLISAFTILVGLRLWVVLDAQSLQSYRESVAYIAILLIVLALSSFMTWAIMRKPGLLAWRAALAPRGLEVGDADAIEQSLLQLMEEQQLFLEPNLTVANVAERLNIAPRLLSHVIATRLGENFSGYVNRKRAEAAAKALCSTTDRAQITRIMYDCGFGSKSAFQREFKRIYGVSPTEYRRQFLECQVCD